MSFLQVAAVGDDCYLLLTDGTIKRWTQGSSTSWKMVDHNPATVQIIGSEPFAQRHKLGHLYKRTPAWTHFGADATKLWGSNNQFWKYQESNGGTLHQIGPHTNDTWEQTDSNCRVKDVVFSPNPNGTYNVFQLTEAGRILMYLGPRGKDWQPINEDTAEADTVALVSDPNGLYKMHRNGVIFQWEGSVEEMKKWKRISSDLRTVAVAAGKAGLFMKMKDGKIYKNSGGTRWNAVVTPPDTDQLVVGNSAYQVNTKGEIFVLLHDGKWKILNDEPVKPPTKPGPSGGVQPAEAYNGGYNTATETRLRIGNGGAGQTRLIEAIGNAFIKYKVSKGSDPFIVAWYKSDTTESIQYLKDGVVDACITYTPAAEDIAVSQGIALSSHYIFREHFCLVGPTDNHANLDYKSCIGTQFIALYKAASEESPDKKTVRFLSRFDKSATNIKESELWLKVGQAPWATKRSAWYHEFIAYPIQALGAAAALGEYTLTDYGTWLSVESTVRNQLAICKKGEDKEDDPLLLPAHLLLGAKAQDLPLAKEFAAWMTDKQGGQAVITVFKKSDEQVYSVAP
ncbi:hypothetical protein N7495_004887 [Penicillium taxi]|uniref:uncharacterized protein n=1 Tax=Penicillium taxi TaxID=168475 RepID=UPI0025450213|nr:uncharacterized protein N7495_004887 [Penicillium taxi]KAJ5900143.1 hypothetical protein N7495_004887 [Penicillium taxi]